MSFSAFNAAKSGLEAYEMRFNDHAQNLSAAGAIAGKERETFLTSLKPASGSLSQSASGIKGSLLNYISNVGLPSPSQIATHVAIQGQGMAIVRDNPDSGEFYYTRVGTFEFDSDKIARNHLGKYVQVFLVNPDTGVPTSGGTDPTTLVPLDISNVVLDPVATNSLSIAYQFSAAILPTDTNRTLSTTMQVHDSRGNPQTLSLTFERVDLASVGGGLVATGTGTSAWAMRVAPPTGGTVNDPYNLAAGDGMIIEFDNTGKPVAFRGDAAGGYVAATTPPNLQITWPAALGAANSDITVNMGTITTLGTGGLYDGVFAAGNQSVYKNVSADNGNAPGNYQDFYWDEDGFGWIKYTSGEAKRYCRMPLSVFANPNGLSPEKDAMYSSSATSGSALINFPKEGSAGTIVPQNWESSTTNGVSVYVKMIQDQKYYMGQLNVIRTVKEMLDGLERL